MNWLLIAIIAHFLSALVFIFDKYLLSNTALRPAAYAFYTGTLGGLSILLFPFGFTLIPAEQIVISFVAGISFVLAILFFYKSVQMGEVSRIVPIIGGLVPIFTFVLTYFFLDERLSSNQLIAFSSLVIGGIVMAWPRKQVRVVSGIIKPSLIKRLPLAVIAALLFASSYVLTKIIFSDQIFINGFIWIRLGGVIGAILLFLVPVSRKVILETSEKIKSKTGGLALVSKGLSGVAFILLNYAIFLGSVALVNALQGVQYIFLLILALFLSKKFPRVIKEQVNQSALIQKTVAILFIIMGLGILVL